MYSDTSGATSCSDCSNGTTIFPDGQDASYARTGATGCSCATGYQKVMDFCEGKACTLDGSGNTEAIACLNGGVASGTTGSCDCSCASGYSGALCATGPTSGGLTCTSKNPAVPDTWCNVNCNAATPYCPPADCACT